MAVQVLPKTDMVFIVKSRLVKQFDCDTFYCRDALTSFWGSSLKSRVPYRFFDNMVDILFYLYTI